MDARYSSDSIRDESLRGSENQSEEYGSPRKGDTVEVTQPRTEGMSVFKATYGIVCAVAGAFLFSS